MEKSQDIKKYDWSLIPNFSRWEFDDPSRPGSGDNIDRETLLNIVQLRLVAGCPIHPHGRMGGCVDMEGLYGHDKDSYHLFKMGCKAIDFHFDLNSGLNPRQQWNFVKGSGFRGIGVYYDWALNGKKLDIGFHGDMRPAKKAQIWKRINGKYIYFLS